ncbi:MAG: YbaB/EbfC family nucleoid-associated protein [Mogibacterium sp.]|nr:YbaB/EbfC family nucleoid-associated protein [Mogibacterium sp.]
MGRGMRPGKKPKNRQPGMGGGRGGQADMQKQLRQLQAMQAEMEQVQAELAEKEITATAGGGAVEVVVNGNKEITKLTIDKDVVDPDDVEMLQDLVIAAVNEAMRQMEELSEAEMSKVTGGLGGFGDGFGGLGGGFGIPGL